MENINIQKIGSIEALSLELAPLIIFTGKQSESKLAIAKLIAIFRNWEFQGKLYDYQTLFERFSIRNILTENSRIQYESEMRKIIFNGEYFEVISKLSKTDEKIRLEEIFKKQVIEVIQTALDEGSKLNKPDYLYTKLSEIKINIESLIIIPAQRISVSAFSEIFTLLRGMNLPMQSILTDFVNRFEVAKKHIGKCELEPWGLTFEYENNEDKILKEGRFFSKLSETTSDIQSILPIKIILEYYSMISAKIQKTAVKELKKLSYLIEEPELHIHPELFPYITTLILNQCNLNTDDLIITTNNDQIAELIKEREGQVKMFNLS